MFCFTVKNSFNFKQFSVIDGYLKEGNIRGGEIAIVEDDPSLRVHILSIALVSQFPKDDNLITIAVKTDFPLESLVGKNIRYADC